MIPQADLLEWRTHAPWKTIEQIEQDLVICRALVALFSHETLRTRIAFRGGTALHKLHLPPAVRYSEDIDLVQVQTGSHGLVIDEIRQALDELLGEPRREWGEGLTTLTYRFPAEPPSASKLRLKVEFNSRESVAFLGTTELPFAVESRWFKANCRIVTYHLNELLATKLRALYQRRKGRDLFDLWYGITLGKAQPPVIVDVFRKYMETEGHPVSQTQYRQNLAAKVNDARWGSDTADLLRPGIQYNYEQAYAYVDQEVLSLL